MISDENCIDHRSGRPKMGDGLLYMPFPSPAHTRILDGWLRLAFQANAHLRTEPQKEIGPLHLIRPI